MECVCVPGGPYTGKERMAISWLAKAMSTRPYPDGTYQARLTTIAAIAAHAGVGQSTVKRALRKATSGPEALFERRAGKPVYNETGRITKREPNIYVLVRREVAASANVASAGSTGWTLTATTSGITGPLAGICRKATETWPNPDREARELEAAIRERVRLRMDDGHSPTEALDYVLRSCVGDDPILEAITLRSMTDAA